MKASKAWTWALTAAGLLQIGMALAHFGLQYEWRGVDSGSLPPQLRWALFALNFSWSTLVLLLGGLTVYAARLNPRTDLVRMLVLIVAVFWTIHGVYMVVEPMPVPQRLAWIRAPIVAFPATVILLLGFTLLSTREDRKAAASAVA